MIQPSALNVLIIGASFIIFAFFWRMIASKLHDNPIGKAMAVIL